MSDSSGPMAIETEAIGYTYPDGIAALAGAPIDDEARVALTDLAITATHRPA